MILRAALFCNPHNWRTRSSSLLCASKDFSSVTFVGSQLLIRAVTYYLSEGAITKVRVARGQGHHGAKAISYEDT